MLGNYIQSATDVVAKKLCITRLVVVHVSVLVFLYFYYLNAVPDCRSDQQNDSFQYLSLARMLLTTGEYRSKHWMPGFPAILMPLCAAERVDWVKLKAAMVATGLLTVLCAYYVYRVATQRCYAKWASLLLMSVPIFFDYSHRAMSEVPSLLLTTLCLTVAAHLHVRDIVNHRTLTMILGGVMLSLFTAAAILVRGNALALLPAYGAAAVMWHRCGHGRVALVFWCSIIVGTVTFILWMAWCSTQNFIGIHNVTYVRELFARDIGRLWEASGDFEQAGGRAGLLEWINRVYQNGCWYHVYFWASIWFPWAADFQTWQSGVAPLLAGVAATPIAVGLLGLTRHRFGPVLIVFWLASETLILIYPTGGAARMQVPHLVVTVLLIVLGLESVFGRNWSVIIIVCAVWINMCLCVWLGEKQKSAPYSRPYFDEFVALSGEISSARRLEETVGCDLPVELYAITGIGSVEKDEAIRRVEGGAVDTCLLLVQGDVTYGSLDKEVIRKGTVWQICRLFRKGEE